MYLRKSTCNFVKCLTKFALCCMIHLLGVPDRLRSNPSNLDKLVLAKGSVFCAKLRKF